ncbi:hypothetical protein Leryth_027603 [Lithospermum erythrorhizon]|nr:hypothetical protein Leryth_027603 [Lithospermum erythrorhizon]
MLLVWDILQILVFVHNFFALLYQCFMPDGLFHLVPIPGIHNILLAQLLPHQWDFHHSHCFLYKICGQPWYQWPHQWDFLLQYQLILQG